MTTKETFLTHKSRSHPEVVGVEYDLHFPELVRQVAEELKAEGMLVEVKGTSIKAMWGAA